MRKSIVLILAMCLILTGCTLSKTLYNVQDPANSSSPSSNIYSDPISSENIVSSKSPSSDDESSVPDNIITSCPDDHKDCVPKGPIEIKVTEDFYAVDALNIFEKFSGVTLVPVYTVDRVGSVVMTQERLGVAMRYYISSNDYLTMVENFKNQGFLEKNIQEHFSGFAFYEGTTENKGEGVLYLEKSENGYSSGVWFLKNHAMDNDYYCVAAHINRENSYNSYIKDNRNIGIKGKLSYSPIERTNSTDFIERIDRIENIK